MRTNLTAKAGLVLALATVAAVLPAAASSAATNQPGPTQTITVSGPSYAVAGTVMQLTATGGGSANPVVLTLDPVTSAAVCSLSTTYPDVVVFNGPGRCVIDANQYGDATHDAAPQVTKSIHVMRNYLYF